jgi:hypothetical protein
MNRKLVLILFLIFTSIFLVVYAVSTTAAPPPPPDSNIDEEKERIAKSVLQAIEDQKEYLLVYLVNEIQISSIELSQDGTEGVIFLELIDPQTGEVLPTEPGLAFTALVDGEWEVILPSDPAWIDLVEAAPQELLTDEYKISYIEMYRTAIQTTGMTYPGYLLPWEAGRTVYLSQSTGHDRYIPSGSAHYSFDFYIYKTMYQLRASKAGTVWRTRWDVPNGNDQDMGNYIVLKDETTSPTTYQLYLHLAQDSIPEELRTIGTYVAQGQFIGVADDTGQSTGHHLHFHVHTNPNSYWGTSVDITFEDVEINGGRPRRESDLPYCTRPGDVCNQFRTYYVSGNGEPVDSIPPIGDLFTPPTGFHLNSNSIFIDGWAYDEHSGIESTHLLAYFNSTWHEVGEAIPGTSFSGNWDLCSDNVPDGPVSLALRIRDIAGNYSSELPGLTHIVKDYRCPRPLIECTPNANQIAVYSDPDYQGICQVLDTGNYNQLTPDIDINIESILSGADVVAEVFSDMDFSGRTDTVHTDDSDLDDNLIRGDQIRSIKVTPRSSVILAPEVLVYPQPGEQFSAGSSLSFSWRYAGPGTEFQVQINGPSGEITSDWLSSLYWISEINQLSGGSYSWKVRARNCPEVSCESIWSIPSTFEITAALPSQPSVMAPFSDSLETGSDNWSSSGLWNLVNDIDRSHNSEHAWYYGIPSAYHYDSSTPNSGSLTSIPILIPDENYQLQFWYRYETEDEGQNWDQRWVQISSDGSVFENILQLANDVNNYWLQAKLDLSQYAGQEIRVRFLFTSLDSIRNAEYEGWLIDDVVISQETPPPCEDGNNLAVNAEPINYGQPLNREICPTGDVDYYKFNGSAGDHIVLDIDTQSSDPVDNLDLILFLLDDDARSELASHDDEILGTLLDPHLGYRLTRDGTYYVRAQLWSHPSHGGENFDYTITLTSDNVPPQGNFIQPATNSFINSTTSYEISVNASDAESNISHVEFLFHSADWLNSDWEIIDIDQDGTDGWGITLDVNDYPEQIGTAFFANIYDWAGNWEGTGTWEIGIDRTPPITNLQNLEQNQESTAIKLQWFASDNISGLDYHQLQTRDNGRDWLNITPNPIGSENSFWFVGQTGTSYDFRMRGVDIAENLEDFPDTPETFTSVPAASVLCSAPDLWDSAGDDNSFDNSTQVDLLASPTTRNYCNPLTADRLFDEDWVNFEVEIGQSYLMESIPTADMTASIIELYDSDGTTMIASSQPDELNGFSRIIWTSDRTGKVYLRARHLDGRIAGNSVTYQLKVNNFLPVFMPIIHR